MRHLAKRHSKAAKKPEFVVKKQAITISPPLPAPIETMRPPRSKKLKPSAAPFAEPVEKYYKNFDFYFKRTSFRTMTLFFKVSFKPYFEKWKQQKRDRSIQDFLREYANLSFPGLLNDLNAATQVEFLELLKLLVFSHRHNKNDAFLQN